jgi:dipeptidase
MCDTLIALSTATADGSVLFAKNSDREPNEAHEVTVLPACDYPAGTIVRCTYIEIPQAAHTHSVLLAKPAWMWGAEMGSNEHGVVIGNEAVFTRLPYEKGAALTGMDLLRLALERAGTARTALDVITGLLREYGQGGNCGFSHPFYYQNSFLIGDPGEAWILETAGREWAAVRVQGIGSISNQLTIAQEWDLASDGLVKTAVEHGWCRGAADFDFQRCYSDPLFTFFSAASHRRACTTARLTKENGRLTAAALMAGLRDHGQGSPDRYNPAAGLTGAEVCMHAGFGPIRINQTTGSLVSRITPGGATHWVTATAAPCTSIFKPVWIDAGLPEHGPRPGKETDPKSLWWRHEALHREVLRDYPERIRVYSDERDRMEGQWLEQEALLRGGSPTERLAFSQRCFDEAETALDRWSAAVQKLPAGSRLFSLYDSAWRSFDRQAGRLKA